MATDLIRNKNGPQGIVGIEAQASLSIPQNAFFVLTDVSTGDLYGLYISNGVLQTVQLGANFKPVGDMTL